MSNEAFIVSGQPQSLSSVPLHQDVEGLTRTLLLSKALDARAPLHIAIHAVTSLVSQSTNKGDHYANLDKHDFDEINVVWSDKGTLIYRFELNGEPQIVTSPATVVIPAGISHRAEAVSGEGLFICILLK